MNYKELEHKLSQKITEDIFNDLVDHINHSPTVPYIKHCIESYTGLKDDASRKYARILLEEFNKSAKQEQAKPDESSFDFSDKYIYDSQNGKYIFLLHKKLGKNLSFDESIIKSIIKSYSNYDTNPHTINEVSIRYSIPRNYLIEILRALGITHDSIPVTNEDFIKEPEDKLLAEIVQEKRFSFNEKLSRIEWTEIREMANKWKELVHRKINPFREYVDNINIEPFQKVNIDPQPVGDTIVIGAFDWQIGSSADGDLLFFGEEWSTQKAIDAVDDFSKRLIARSKSQNITDAVIVFGGDIFHGLNGKTAKGTTLKCDTFRHEQFDAAVKAISLLIHNCASNFNSVKCEIVTGNHEGWEFYPVFRLVEALFVNYSHVDFNICLKEFTHFMVNDSLFLVHHGASADYKFKVPSDRKGRVALAQRVLRIAEREGGYVGVKRVFFIKGDTHAFECMDLGQIMFYTFGSLPTGDEYANALALENTPTQNALVIGKGKDFSTLHLAF